MVGGVEEYLAVNEYIASDFSGSAGAITGMLSALSIAVGTLFVEAIPLGFKIYVVSFAVIIAGVSFLAMYKNGSHDATRRAVLAIYQERVSSQAREVVVQSPAGRTNPLIVGSVAIGSAVLTYLVLGSHKAT